MTGASLTVLPSVDSTNNYAMQRVHDGTAGHGDAFAALEQTAGKGQRGRQWHTGANENLAFTMVLQPALPISQQFLLSACIATAARQLLHTHHPCCTIKWPNDLYYGNKKAGGILIENVLRGPNWLFAVAGTGLNVNQASFPPHLVNPISLRQLTGTTLDIVELAHTYWQLLEAQWNLLLSNPAAILAAYRQHLYKKGEAVRLRHENRVLNTIIYDVSDEGRLLTGEYGETEFSFGEVEWIAPSP